MSINKLGIYYTDNHIPKIISYTIDQLVPCCDVVDIKTCGWKKIPNNPFPHIMAMTTSRNHLNIIIQILQLLYDSANKQYKYVLFLEHDVIYPREYFYFPEFDDGCLINRNYIGLCKDGFQKLSYFEHPLHQIVMLYNDAISHFEKIIFDAIKSGSVCMEANLNKNIWSSTKSCIHINHGSHFTTHFRTYSSERYVNDKDWGNYYDIYKNLI